MIGYLLWQILEWIVEELFGSLFAWLLTEVSAGATDVFTLDVVKLLIKGAKTVGTMLWGVGVVYAVFDMAIQYSRGRGGPHDLALNFVRSYAAVLLFTVLPVPFYQAMITYGGRIGGALAGGGTGFTIDLSKIYEAILGVDASFVVELLLLIVLFVLTLLNCFALLKRSFFAFCLTVFGCVHMFSLPRGYADGFLDWCKQLIGLGMTAFFHMVLLGLSSYLLCQGHLIVGWAGMLAGPAIDPLLQRYGGGSFQQGSGVGSKVSSGAYLVSNVSHLIGK